MAKVIQGDLAGAVAQFGEVAAEAEAAHDEIWRADSLPYQGLALAYQGDTGAARAAADAAVEAAAELGGIGAGVAYAGLAVAALAAGDVATALDASEAAWQHVSVLPAAAAVQRVFNAEAALADGDLVAARGWAEDAVTTTTGWWLMAALTTRARVAIAQGEPEQAERDAHDALTRAAEIEAYLCIPDILECLATLAGEAGSHREAARLFGAAEAIRQRMGAVAVQGLGRRLRGLGGALRDALGEKDFDSPRGPRARRYPPRRRSPTPSAAAANANDPPAAGHHSPPPSTTSCAWSATGWPTTTSPHGFSSHHAPCKPTSPTSTPNSG